MSLNAAGGSAKVISRSTAHLYRDCLRLVQHIAGKSKKGDNIRNVVRGEFRKNVKLEDPAQIENLKSGAVRALTNYLMIQSISKDQKLQKNASRFMDKETNDMKNEAPPSS